MKLRLVVKSPFICAAAGLVMASIFAYAQAQTDIGAKQDVEVLRINTELVQSPVMVFDKQGHFVDGLQRDQFQLLIDGKPQPITFFDRVTAGTSAEAVKLEAARRSGATPDVAANAPKSSVYGRTLIFFVDDLHLTQESVNRVRGAISKFIDESMGQNDRALITTASGQVGFLQQVTDNKDVLHAAVERLKQRQSPIFDDERPPMAPYQALSIEYNNSEVLKYYVEMYFADAVQHMSEGDKIPNAGGPSGPGGAVGGPNASAMADMKGEQGRRIAEVHVRARARNILSQYTSVTASAFASLRYLMSSTLELPGNKLIFVLSDGFYLNKNVAGESQKLKEVTSAAQRAGAVIYSIQASGLGSQYPDAKSDLRQGSRMPMNLPRAGNDQDLQAPLYTLAVDTGGRALFNSNDISAAIKTGLNETSEYYLIAWRPETAAQKTESFKEIRLAVKDHPEYTVRVHKSYMTTATESVAATTATKPGKGAAPAPSTTLEQSPVANAAQANQKISEALSQSYPVAQVPISVNARFSDTPDGLQIMVGTEISIASLFAAVPDDRQTHTLDLIGVVLNDNGKTVASFRGQLNAEASPGTAASIRQTTEVKTKPGLYQVRVAARDQKTGAVGSAWQWVTVPDLSEKRIAMSSLFVGERKQPQQADPRIPLSINHHFTSDSRLRFFASIYNARSNGGAKPDISLQTIIFHDDQPIITGPLVKAATEGIDDLTRIPFAAEISLRTLRPGPYVLQLTATDNVAKSSTVQRVKFLVE
ncbi:MAG TPA: VWA domain-containing protein [Pyrinomonadaceae bacterium]|nr:VWA domain-containing protein [Pyrinomonadaceae bacterium]